jgi:hypothetical protein
VRLPELRRRQGALDSLHVRGVRQRLIAQRAPEGVRVRRLQAPDGLLVQRVRVKDYSCEPES